MIVGLPVRRSRAGLSLGRISLPHLNAPLLLSLVLYLGIGSYFSLVLQAFQGDAYSRVANAYYVLFSRDPHLAAIGFVWTPLPSLVELLFTPVSLVWSPMVRNGFAAVLMSGLFMAGAVYQIDKTLRELQVRSVARNVLVAAFALNPMVVYYGAIGTSEAPMAFFMILCARHLMAWTRHGTIDRLALAGLALAGAYMTRYEAALAAAGAIGIVGLLGLLRTPGQLRRRFQMAAADALILGAPFVLVFVAWALASWLIVGDAFAQFSSAYGNSSQIAVWKSTGGNEFGYPLDLKLSLTVLRLFVLQAALPLGLALALVLSVSRRDLRLVALLAVFGPALVFMALAYLLNVLAPWLRYLMPAVPLGILLLGLCLSSAVAVPRPSRPSRLVGRWASLAITPVLLFGAAIAIPVTGMGILNRQIAVEESQDLGGIIGPRAAQNDRPGWSVRSFAGERIVAAYLDSLRLPDGSIVLDVFLNGFAIVTQSDRPRQFVITPDRDFAAILANPAAFGVQYLLAPDNAGQGVLDAVNRAYPGLVPSAPSAVSSGHPVATLVRVFPQLGTSGRWWLFRVNR
jgi:hypothetical protein